MGIYRTYFDKNNTIIKNSRVNTGRNPVSELFYGDMVSRFLFYCSFDELKDKIENKEIIIDQNIKHVLKIKNTSSFDISPYLSESNNLVFEDKYRSSSFDLELRPIQEFWDEGMGYEFSKNPNTQIGNRDYSEETSNWFNGTLVNEFNTPGGTLGSVIDTQHFDKGSEDVSMDVTEFVNTLLVSGTTTGITENYNGFCLKYTNDIENLTNNNRVYTLGLYTKHTQTYFEPYIETYFDDHISDNRVDFFLNKNNKLFLYVNVDGKLTNLDILPTCTIEGVILDNQLIVKQKTKGVYYVELLANSETFDSYVEYKDVWSNIRINGINRPDIKLTFVPKEDVNYYQVGSHISDPIRYGVSVSGIKNDEKLNQGEVKKVLVHLRKPYTVNQQDVITNLYYKIYIKQGNGVIDIVNWDRVNKIYNTNSFNIDTTWLIPQNYFVDIKLEMNGEVNIYNEILKFKINNNYKWS